MNRGFWVAVVPFCLLLGCPPRQRPTGPPEYEVPRVMPWDAAAPVDPLDNLEGEAVTDDPEPARTRDHPGRGGAGRGIRGRWQQRRSPGWRVIGRFPTRRPCYAGAPWESR